MSRRRPRFKPVPGAIPARGTPDRHVIAGHRRALYHAVHHTYRGPRLVGVLDPVTPDGELTDDGRLLLDAVAAADRALARQCGERVGADAGAVVSALLAAGTAPTVLWGGRDGSLVAPSRLASVRTAPSLRALWLTGYLTAVRVGGAVRTRHGLHSGLRYIPAEPGHPPVLRFGQLPALPPDVCR